MDGDTSDHSLTPKGNAQEEELHLPKFARKVLLMFLTAFVFFLVLLHFKELNLFLLSSRLLWWGVLIFTASLVCIIGVRIASVTPRWLRERPVASLSLAIVFVFFIIIIILLVMGVFSEPIGKRYNYALSELTSSNISKYLELNPELITPALLESRIHIYINEARAEQRLTELSYDAPLASIARNHSADMVSKDYFDHINPSGEDAIKRGNKAGYKCFKEYKDHTTNGIAENLATTPLGNVKTCGQVYDLDTLARCTVNGWLNSPPHRRNVLHPDYDREGIGVVQKGKHEFYITQNFC